MRRDRYPLYHRLAGVLHQLGLFENRADEEIAATITALLGFLDDALDRQERTQGFDALQEAYADQITQ